MDMDPQYLESLTRQKFSQFLTKTPFDILCDRLIAQKEKLKMLQEVYERCAPTATQYEINKIMKEVKQIIKEVERCSKK